RESDWRRQTQLRLARATEGTSRCDAGIRLAVRIDPQPRSSGARRHRSGSEIRRADFVPSQYQYRDGDAYVRGFRAVPRGCREPRAVCDGVAIRVSVASADLALALRTAFQSPPAR